MTVEVGHGIVMTWEDCLDFALAAGEVHNFFIISVYVCNFTVTSKDFICKNYDQQRRFQFCRYYRDVYDFPVTVDDDNVSSTAEDVHNFALFVQAVYDFTSIALVDIQSCINRL